MPRRRRPRIGTGINEDEQPSSSQSNRGQQGRVERTDHDYIPSNANAERHQSNNTTGNDNNRPSSASNVAQMEDEDLQWYEDAVQPRNSHIVPIFRVLNFTVEQLDDSSDFEELENIPDLMVPNNNVREQRLVRSPRRLTSSRRTPQRVPSQSNVQPSRSGSLSIGGSTPSEPPPETSASPPTVAVAQEGATPEASPQDSDNELPTTSSAKKRKLSPDKSNSPSAKAVNLNESNDFAQCSICLDDWEMSGEHRLVSLKCGHLYGDSCIRRWMGENTRKFCPQCKTKIADTDLRYLYAKRIYAVDRSEEQNLREQLKKEKFEIQQLKTSISTLQMSLTMANQRVCECEIENKRLKNILMLGGMIDSSRPNNGAERGHVSYRLSLDRNIDISRETGSRVMAYSNQHETLLVSQLNDPRSLFPGYGVRYIDMNTFRPSQFVFASSKLLRDISLSDDQKLYAVAAIDNIVKIFDLTTRVSSTTLSCNNRPLWACSFGKKTRDNFIYIGTQNGSVCVYDIRAPNVQLQEYRCDGDISPVIHIEQVPNSCTFPNGGILVCTLQSLWFHEYTQSCNEFEVVTTCLCTDGPFTSMTYNHERKSLLVSARSNKNFPKSRYIIGKLDKVDDTPAYCSKIILFSAKAAPVMTRCAQIFADDLTMVSGYVQDEKMLALYDIRRESRIQSLPVNSLIYDMCPLYLPSSTYLAALTESKCRIYKLNAVN